MKLFFKCTVYVLLMAAIILVCLNIFKYHPEAQFAFIFPGIFIVIFSYFIDDTFYAARRLRSFRER